MPVARGGGNQRNHCRGGFRGGRSGSCRFASRESRCRKPSSANAAEVADYFLEYQCGRQELCPRDRDRYLARISEVEVTSALARRRGEPGLSVAQAREALGLFRQDFAQDYRIVEVTVPLLQRAALLADTHAPRGYDAVQLAAVLEVQLQVPALIWSRGMGT